MITGAHVLCYSSNAEADRSFFRDVLGWPHVDAGGGWLIFALPPSEIAVHPAGDGASAGAGGRRLDAEVYLMCDDLQGQIASLRAKNVACGPIEKERWGTRTTIRLPSGREIGLYQPTHSTAI